MKKILKKLSGEKGTALMMALYAMFIVSILIGIGFSLLYNSMSIMKRQLHYRGQAENIAKAGLVEAHSWLRRQSTQPIKTSDPSDPSSDDYGFNPVVDTSDPSNEINDSEEPNIGIVRHFQIGDRSLHWGRYEVRRYSARTPYASESAYTWRDKNVESYCKDISAERGQSASSGTIWHMECVGYIYVEHDATKDFYESPNKIIHHVVLATEYQRLGLNLCPGAIHLDEDTGLHLANKARVDGIDDPGLVWHGSDTGDRTGPGDLTGTPTEQLSNDSLSVNTIFGVSQDQLKNMADYYVTSTSDLPDIRFSMSIIYIEGNAQFTSTKPLKGSGILFVDGNLTFTNNCGVYWSGLVYCTGNISMGDTAVVMGTVVGVGENCNVHSTGGGSMSDVAEITYDGDILQQIQQKIGQYRMTRSPYRVE
jgi:hypothetical protein